MPAKNGAPVYTVPSLVEGGQEWEVQEPESTTLLAVCPDCGFEFCASHTVEKGGKQGFICYRCRVVCRDGVSCVDYDCRLRHGP